MTVNNQYGYHLVYLMLISAWNIVYNTFNILHWEFSILLHLEIHNASQRLSCETAVSVRLKSRLFSTFSCLCILVQHLDSSVSIIPGMASGRQACKPAALCLGPPGADCACLIESYFLKCMEDCLM